MHPCRATRSFFVLLLVAWLGLVAPPASAAETSSGEVTWTGGTPYFVIGDGPPVVLIHGFGDSKESWRPVAAKLAERFRVYAYDTLGFGACTNPLDTWTIEAYVGQLHRLLDALSIENPILVGNSMGAQIALAYVNTHRWIAETTPPTPTPFAGLVLIDPSGAPGATRELGAAMMAINGAANVSGELDADEVKKVVTGVLHDVFHDDARVTPALIDAFSQTFRSPQGRRALKEVIRAFRFETLEGLKETARWWRRGVGRRLGRTPKIQILWGKHDVWFPVAQLDAYRSIAAATGFPKVEGGPFATQVIEAAGHVPQIERPDDVAAAISAFFARR